MSINKAFPVPVDLRNVDQKIYRVIESVHCSRHDVEKGVPCYSVTRDSSSIPAYGICNHRAKGAGMRGKISDQAVMSARTNRMSYAQGRGTGLDKRIRSKNFPKPANRAVRKSA